MDSNKAALYGPNDRQRAPFSRQTGLFDAYTANLTQPTDGALNNRRRSRSTKRYKLCATGVPGPNRRTRCTSSSSSSSSSEINLIMRRELMPARYSAPSQRPPRQVYSLSPPDFVFSNAAGTSTRRSRLRLPRRRRSPKCSLLSADISDLRSRSLTRTHGDASPAVFDMPQRRGADGCVVWGRPDVLSQGHGQRGLDSTDRARAMRRWGLFGPWTESDGGTGPPAIGSDTTQSGRPKQPSVGRVVISVIPADHRFSHGWVSVDMPVSSSNPAPPWYSGAEEAPVPSQPLIRMPRHQFAEKPRSECIVLGEPARNSTLYGTQQARPPCVLSTDHGLGKVSSPYVGQWVEHARLP
ncbi:hypothetical protein ColLi_04952 [Colletotrichum liriopes]|uniref:Uncharacterized protein n=1 Tax=Colletotrichum liriopes TaxID=708192 RepID=A0AA37GK14_9PEZI|nr:hypothetical protein ColLi_04952 [Colletotrichum liriopes]